MADCIFCKIASGEIPCRKVYETDDIIAFHDLSPQAPVHVLVIPKNHIESCAKVSEEYADDAAKCLVAVAKVAELLGLDSFRVVSNCGEQAGQSVMHLHFHVLSGRDFAWPPG